MILIRGIKGTEYAKRILQKKIGCRDLLTTVINTNNSGYEFSDYYEKYFVHAFSKLKHLSSNCSETYKKIQMALDDIVPYIYVTYFHILNDNSEEWVENSFEDDYDFIYYIPRLDTYTMQLIGSGFFGKQLEYVDRINDAREMQDQFVCWGLLSMIDNYSAETVKITGMLSYVFNALLFPFFQRVRDAKFNDRENEFRIVKIIPPIIDSEGYLHYDEVRTYNILIDGTPYLGRMEILERETSMLSQRNISLIANSPLVRKRYTTILDAYREGKTVEFQSQFSEIDISKLSSGFGYIGGKKECIEFIKKARKWNSYKNNKGRQRITYRKISPEQIPNEYEYHFHLPKLYVNYSDYEDNY